MLIRLLLLVCVIFVGACASTGADKPHVLSGEAPVEEVVAKGDEMFGARDYVAAAILYQIAIQQEPTADCWFKLGVTKNQLKNSEQALYAFFQALDLDANHPGALEKLGLYYTSKGDTKHARIYLDRLVDVDADSWKAHNSLGIVADLEKDFTTARYHYTEALKLRPDLAILWNNLGYSAYLLGDFARAKTYMSRALELDSNLESAKSNLALVYVREANYEQALDTFDQNRDIAGAYTNVGYLAYRVGDLDKAEELLEEAIRQSPTYNKSAHAYLAATRRANR